MLINEYRADVHSAHFFFFGIYFTVIKIWRGERVLLWLMCATLDIIDIFPS